MVQPTAIGVLTSGGDAQGMNAALRAVVRTALARSVPVYAICEGYQGMVEGGAQIRPLTWDNVGGIQQRGGTIIGTARSAAFRQRGAAARGDEHHRHAVQRGGVLGLHGIQRGHRGSCPDADAVALRDAQRHKGSAYS